MDPRISFSYGFADIKHQQREGASIDKDAVLGEPSTASSSTTPDFESSAIMNMSSSCAAAEELFCQGKIKIKAAALNKVSTLRDELLVNHDNEDANRGRKGWKDRFGFRKTRNQTQNNSALCSAAQPARL